MSTQRGAWITRRGQGGVEEAIDQVLDHQPQPGEQVQQMPDELIEDSPYQARQLFNDESVEELAQGMREVGFQGVLIVRPHSDGSKRRRGVFQLVYGHRRRAAWRRVCIERDVACLLPVVVREVSDERMLLIGAQENVQRQDLDPVEEGQIVAWLQRMFPQQNQAELGALLGKSSDWVSVRTRVHRLPDALKERLRQRPRAISQMLELGGLAVEHLDTALLLADRIVNENLTLEAVRALLRGYKRPEQREPPLREEQNDRRGAATSVQGVTNDQVPVLAGDPEETQDKQSNAVTGVEGDTTNDRSPIVPVRSPLSHRSVEELRAAAGSPGTSADGSDIILLQEAATALASVASRAINLPDNVSTIQMLDQAEQALVAIRQIIVRRAIPGIALEQPRPYRLIDTDLHEMLVQLRSRHPIVATLCPMQDQGSDLRLVMCLLPTSQTRPSLPNAWAGDLFIAVAGAGNGITSLAERVPQEWILASLQLSQSEAAIVGALISDLVRGQAEYKSLD